jgi:membrane protein YdbS with pleckstrin-like domain
MVNTNSGVGGESLGRGLGDTTRGAVTGAFRPIGFVVSPILRLIAALAVGVFLLAAVAVGLADLFAGILYWLHPSHYPFLMTFALIAVFLLLAAGAQSIRDRL